MKVLLAFLAIAVAQAFADGPILPPAPEIKPGEIKAVVSDIDKVLKESNITAMTDADKRKMIEGLQQMANFKIEEHPEIMKAAKELKMKIPELKAKICKFADKVDGKIPDMSKKVGLGVQKGFTKLGQEKFPAAVAKFQELVKDAAVKGNRPDLSTTLKPLSEQIQQCMFKHLTAIATPLSAIISNAGAKNQNAFSHLVEPFIDDCEAAKRR